MNAAKGFVAAYRNKLLFLFYFSPKLACADPARWRRSFSVCLRNENIVLQLGRGLFDAEFYYPYHLLIHFLPRNWITIKQRPLSIFRLMYFYIFRAIWQPVSCFPFRVRIFPQGKQSSVTYWKIKGVCFGSFAAGRSGAPRRPHRARSNVISYWNRKRSRRTTLVIEKLRLAVANVP